MAELRLPNLRIGFAYGARIVFPPNFLQVGESCRAKLRKYVAQPVASAEFVGLRTGDIIDLDLTEAQTMALQPGEYLTELIIYEPANPAAAEIPITDNLFRISADFSPST